MTTTAIEVHYKVAIMAMSVVIMILIGMVTTAPVLAGSDPQARVIEKHVNQEVVMDRRICSSSQFNIEMVLRSPSGDPVENDTTLWIVQSDSAKPVNAAKPGYIAFISSANENLWNCDGAAVYHVSKNIIAIPLFLSDRPNLDLLAVAIYDFEKKQVLNYSVLERFYAEEPKLRQIKAGFSYLAVSAQPNDSPVGLVETWLNVTWDGKKVLKKWDRTRPEVRH